MPAELVHSHRLQTGKLGFLTTTASAFLTAEAEADGIIHAGWGSVNGKTLLFGRNQVSVKEEAGCLFTGKDRRQRFRQVLQFAGMSLDLIHIAGP